MTPSANENPRYVCAPFIDRWAVYDRTKNQGEAVLCLTLSESNAKDIAALLNRASQTVNDTLDSALRKLEALRSKNLPDCDPKNSIQWDDAITACCAELQQMRVR